METVRLQAARAAIALPHNLHYPHKLLWLQAADILSIEGHVKEVCKVLAARLITAKRKREDGSSECFPAQMHPRA
jgi:hypothetical protein